VRRGLPFRRMLGWKQGRVKKTKLELVTGELEKRFPLSDNATNRSWPNRREVAGWRHYENSQLQNGYPRAFLPGHTQCSKSSIARHVRRQALGEEFAE
jgi:hypothetical protein